MEIINKNMDKISEILRCLIHRLNRSEEVPLRHIGEDIIQVVTKPKTYLEIAYQAEGEQTEFFVEDRTILSEPGTLLLLNAHFGNHAYPPGPWSYWCLSLDISGFSELADIGQGALLLSRRLTNTDNIVEKYRNICFASEKQDILKNIRIKTEVLSLLCLIFSKLQPDNVDKKQRSFRIEKALQAMHEHYADSTLDLKKIAKFAGLSHIHFGRIFKQELGETPMKYLNLYRIKKAEVLLKRSDIFIGEVGDRVGFADRLHFSRVFRKIKGISPRQYRVGNHH